MDSVDQLVAMACAVPLLIASQWRMFHTVRVVAMVGTALMAGLWIVERVRVLEFTTPSAARASVELSLRHHS